MSDFATAEAIHKALMWANVDDSMIGHTIICNTDRINHEEFRKALTERHLKVGDFSTTNCVAVWKTKDFRRSPGFYSVVHDLDLDAKHAREIAMITQGIKNVMTKIRQVAEWGEFHVAVDMGANRETIEEYLVAKGFFVTFEENNCMLIDWSQSIKN